MVASTEIQGQQRRQSRLWVQALAAAVIYFGLAVLWFGTFERLAAKLAATPEQQQLYKGLVGLFFVIASAFGASWIVWRELRKQHRIQDALRNSESRLARLVESAMDAIVSVDAQLRIVVFNPAAQKMFGCSAADAHHRDLRQFIPEFSEGMPLAALRSRGQSDRVWSVKGRRSNASEFSAEASVSRKGADGDESCTLVIRDVSDRVRLEEELRQTNASLEQRVVERTADLQAVNRELESFCYSVAHDLRAPLRSIQGFSALLGEEASETLNEPARAHLGRIEAASKRMEALIDAWLQLSRVARGEIRWEPVDLSPIAAAVVSELRHADPSRKVEFLCCSQAAMRGDPNLLHILLQNLLGNAWKFTANAPEARIEFGVNRPNGSPTYFVRDNGAGFEMKYAGKLFQPFERLHPSHDFEGTGIGLATCQRIVLRHGGRIWAEARVNQGATLNFIIPDPQVQPAAERISH
jgi:PAS domain S-box-containing protein